MQRTHLMLLPVVALLSFAAGAALQEGGGGMTPATPGEEHALLERMAGSWTTHLNMMGNTSEGKHEKKLDLGGLWLVGRMEGEFMGQPFTGIDVIGWDPEKEKYVGIWVDNFTAAIQTLEGSYDPEAQRLEFEAPSVNPMTGEPVTELHRWDLSEEDRLVYSMLFPSPDGGEFELFAVEYTR